MMYVLRPFAALLTVAGLAACSSTPLQTPPAPTRAPPPPSAAVDTTPPGTQGGVATVTVDPLDDPASGLGDRSVYFGYDVYTVDDRYQPLVQKHARYLQGRPGTRIRVEGNTDERGSREYNLALGEERAQAVARSLQLLGVAAGQVEAVSYGAERPKSQGHDETAWAQNRRADIRYLGR